MAVVEFGPPIPLALAKKIAERAEKEALANGWALVFAIMDSGGNLVLLHKMDHAQLGSVAIAQGKARTALNFKRPTKAIEDAIAAGGKGLRILAVEGPLSDGRRRAADAAWQNHRRHRRFRRILGPGRPGRRGSANRDQRLESNRWSAANDVASADPIWPNARRGR